MALSTVKLLSPTSHIRPLCISTDRWQVGALMRKIVVAGHGLRHGGLAARPSVRLGVGVGPIGRLTVIIRSRSDAPDRLIACLHQDK
jgi:hypothetical protein